MPIFCEQNVHFLKNTITCDFLIFSWRKPSLSSPHMGKKLILSKLRYINYWPKKSKGYPYPFFLLIITKKKNTALRIQRPFSLKPSAIMSIFQNFSLKTLCSLSHIWSKYVNSVKTLWAKKVNKIFIFSDFLR